MSSEDLDDIPGEYLDIEHLPDIPECRITATADPAGMLRFEMSRERAEAVLEQVEETIAAAPAEPDRLLDLVIILDYPAYASLTKGLAQLHQADDLMAKQVRVEPTEPELALSVVVNDSQIESSMRKNYAALKQYGDDRVYGQRFSVSRNGLVALAQQLEAALDGHDDPLETVDVDDERFSEFDEDPDVATDGGHIPGAQPGAAPPPADRGVRDWVCPGCEMAFHGRPDVVDSAGPRWRCYCSIACYVNDLQFLGAELHKCDLCDQVFDDVDALVEHDCDPSIEEILTDGGRDVRSVDDTERYRVGDAAEELRQLGSGRAAVVCLDDAWSRPGRQGAFGVEYPTHSLEVSYELVDVSWDALKPGGWLILDADDWLAPRLESYIREGYGDVTAYGDYQGGGYRRRGAVTYVDVSGEPDRSTPGQYLSNAGYPVVFAHKGETDRRTTVGARQVTRHPRRVEDGYPYGWGSVKPVGPYREWIDGLTEPGETVIVPCAGTAPAAIAAEQLGREWIAVDSEPDAREAYLQRRDALLEVSSEQSTLVHAADGGKPRSLSTGTERSDEDLRTDGGRRALDRQCRRDAHDRRHAGVGDQNRCPHGDPDCNGPAGPGLPCYRCFWGGPTMRDLTRRALANGRDERRQGTRRPWTPDTVCYDLQDGDVRLAERRAVEVGLDYRGLVMTVRDGRWIRARSEDVVDARRSR